MAANVVHLSIALLSLLFVFLGALIYARKKMQISFGVVGLGALAFFLAVNVLESLLHRLILQPTAEGSIGLMKQAPFFYVLYAILAAGIFEESARWLIFKLVEKKRSLRFSDGLAYGLGHGGIELLLLGGATLLIYLLVYLAGPSFLAKVPPILAYQAWSLSAISIYLVVIERLLAFALQLCLSFWVLYAVEKKKSTYFFLAIGFHALIDLPAALWQIGLLGNLWLVYALLAFELVALFFLSRKYILRGKKIGN